MNKRQLRALRQIREHLEMKNCSFNRIGGVREGPQKLPTTEADVTAFIIARTRLWRTSWVTGPLDELLKELEKCCASPQKAASSSSPDGRG